MWSVVIVVDAKWEKRNLGVSCYEITIDDSDSIDDIKEYLKIYSAEYMVVRVPVCRTDIMFYLTSKGYTCVESIISLNHNLKMHYFTPTQVKLSENIDFIEMEPEDINYLFSQIKKGMFNTDRIYLDPFFTREKAAKRYIGWLNDELLKGSHLYKITFNAQEIGFSGIRNENKGEYKQFLTGLYENARGHQMGFSIIYQPIKKIKQLNGKLFTTDVSTNNVPSLKVHIQCGCIPSKIQYIYTKHNYS